MKHKKMKLKLMEQKIQQNPIKHYYKYTMFNIKKKEFE